MGQKGFVWGNLADVLSGPPPCHSGRIGLKEDSRIVPLIPSTYYYRVGMVGVPPKRRLGFQSLGFKV